MKIRDKIRAVEADAIRHAEAHGAYAASPVISLDFAHTLDEAAAHLERSVPASQLRALVEDVLRDGTGTPGPPWDHPTAPERNAWSIGHVDLARALLARLEEGA